MSKKGSAEWFKKQQQQGMPKVTVDKTFGLKNKNKSKQVQKYVDEVAASKRRAAEGGRKERTQEEARQKEKEAKKLALAMDAMLFKEVAKKKRSPEAVEADEKKRAAAEAAKAEENRLANLTLEEKIEEERAQLTTRTPVTLERLNVWLKAKQDAKAAKEESTLEKARQVQAQGKALHGLTGKQLFAIAKNLFIDDEEADSTKYERPPTPDPEDEEGEEGEEGDALAGVDESLFTADLEDALPDLEEEESGGANLARQINLPPPPASGVPMPTSAVIKPPMPPPPTPQQYDSYAANY